MRPATSFISHPNLGPIFLKSGFICFTNTDGSEISSSALTFNSESISPSTAPTCAAKSSDRHGIIILESGWRTRTRHFLRSESPIEHILCASSIRSSSPLSTREASYTGKSAKCTEMLASRPVTALRSRNRRSAKNGATGLISTDTVSRQVYNVW